MSNDRRYDFVRSENVKEFQRRLQAESDPQKRKLIQELLTRELSRKPPDLSAGMRSDRKR